MTERDQVLITRPEPDAAETARIVAARGFVPVVAPVMTVNELEVSPEGRFDAILVTSRNAIPALPASLHGTALLAVGRATAERARASGFTQVDDADGDASALLSLTLHRLAPGASVLFAHGEGQGDALAEALDAEGFRVTRRAAYAVTPASVMPPAAVRAMLGGRLRAAMFLSAETGRSFVRLLPTALHARLTDTAAVAIGAAAADALTPLPWREVRVSVRPNLEEVLTLL